MSDSLYRPAVPVHLPVLISSVLAEGHPGTWGRDIQQLGGGGDHHSRPICMGTRAWLPGSVEDGMSE